MLIFSKMRKKRDYYDVTEIIFYKSRSLESVSIVSQKCRSPLVEFARISIFDIHVFLERKKKEKKLWNNSSLSSSTPVSRKRDKNVSPQYTFNRAEPRSAFDPRPFVDRQYRWLTELGWARSFFSPRLISRLRSVSLSIIVAERRKRTAERMAVANEPLVAGKHEEPMTKETSRERNAGMIGGEIYDRQRRIHGADY